MEVVLKFYNHFLKALSRKNKYDGRILLGTLLIIYFLSIVFSSLFTNYYDFWNKLGVPARPQPFGDLRVITSGWECNRLGYNVYLENPCNPWPYFQEFNYPRLWILPASFGFNQSHTVLLGILSASLVFIMMFLFIGRLNYAEALIYSIILCSPAVMLGVERGNNDLVIFIILSIALFFVVQQKTILRIAACLAIMLASVLKLYPIFALTIFLKEKKINFWLLTFLCGGFFGVYVFATLSDIKLISAATPRVNFWSYGCRIIFNLFANDFSNFLGNTEFIEKIAAIISSNKFIYSIVLVSIVTLLIKETKNNSVSYINNYNDMVLASFRVGASIYIGTFIIGNNWAYRLIFLIFTIPQVLTWIKSNNCLSFISSISLIGVILTLWIKTTVEGIGVYFDQLINWFLFFYFIYTLILTLPNWLKSLLKIYLSFTKFSVNNKIIP